MNVDVMISEILILTRVANCTVDKALCLLESVSSLIVECQCNRDNILNTYCFEMNYIYICMYVPG